MNKSVFQLRVRSTHIVFICVTYIPLLIKLCHTLASQFVAADETNPNIAGDRDSRCFL